MTWICEDCGFECNNPRWTQQEFEDSFIEVPCCPDCWSFHINDSSTQSIKGENE